MKMTNAYQTVFEVVLVFEIQLAEIIHWDYKGLYYKEVRCEIETLGVITF